jgi:flagellar hook-basal body complex protein FliE
MMMNAIDGLNRFSFPASPTNGTSGAAAFGKELFTLDATATVGDSPQQEGGQTAGSTNVLSQFGNTLSTELERVNQLQAEAQTNVQAYAIGEDVPLHQVMMSLNKAETSLQLATQIRNKLVGAYQEISRMQV